MAQLTLGQWPRRCRQADRQTGQSCHNCFPAWLSTCNCHGVPSGKDWSLNSGLNMLQLRGTECFQTEVSEMNGRHLNGAIQQTDEHSGATILDRFSEKESARGEMLVWSML